MLTATVEDYQERDRVQWTLTIWRRNEVTAWFELPDDMPERAARRWARAILRHRYGTDAPRIVDITEITGITT